MLSLLEECPVFKRNAIKGDRIQYAWKVTCLSSLINTSNSCVWGDEKGKHICHPATTWNAASLRANLLYRATDSPENPELPLEPIGARYVVASFLSTAGPTSPWLTQRLHGWPNVCHTHISVTSRSISLNWYLGFHLQAWPKERNQWMLFCSLPHNYFFPM